MKLHRSCICSCNALVHSFAQLQQRSCQHPIQSRGAALHLLADTQNSVLCAIAIAAAAAAAFCLCVCAVLCQVLSNLRDVRVVSLTGDDAGSFRLEFQFEKNPFFTNEVSL